MCAKKNLSAKDLSEKFGFKISEKDLEPEVDKDCGFLNQMADLSELVEEPEKPAKASKEDAPAEPEKEPTFAELFEGRGAITEVKEEEPAPAPKAKKEKRIVDEDDSMDFGKLFNMSTAKVVDKDKVVMRDEDYAPFEINEDEMPKQTSFHGFDDLAKAFGGGKKRR